MELQVRKTLYAPFRLEHYRQLLCKLLDRGDVEFITYKDLAWQLSDDHKTGYPAEWCAWHELASGRRSSKTVYILIQHDIDSGPTQTVDMMEMEGEYGVVSTTMLFRRWRGDSISGPLVDYPVDFARLQALERMGFVFGYHCNALHNAAFDEEPIYRLFMEDLGRLRELLDIRFYSPHGGHTKDGVGNASFDFLTVTGADVKHVHNGASPRFTKTYSDGGLIKRLQERPHEVDFITWCDQLVPGGRYRMLIHPQYYCDENFRPIESIQANWYRQLLNLSPCPVESKEVL